MSTLHTGGGRPNGTLVAAEDEIGRLNGANALLHIEIGQLRRQLTNEMDKVTFHCNEAAKARVNLVDAKTIIQEKEITIVNLRESIKLHAGDTLTLSAEIDDWKARAEEAEARNATVFGEGYQTGYNERSDSAEAEIAMLRNEREVLTRLAYKAQLP